MQEPVFVQQAGMTCESRQPRKPRLSGGSGEKAGESQEANRQTDGQADAKQAVEQIDCAGWWTDSAYQRTTERHGAEATPSAAVIPTDRMDMW